MLEGEGGDNFWGTGAWEREPNEGTGESFIFLHVVEKLDRSEASTCPYTSLPPGLYCTAEIPTVRYVPSAEISEKIKMISDSGI